MPTRLRAGGLGTEGYNHPMKSRLGAEEPTEVPGRLISVVLPALNEEENVEPCYERLRAAAGSLPRFRWEFIFVDDGSSDATLDRVIGLRKGDPRIRALRL